MKADRCPGKAEHLRSTTSEQLEKKMQDVADYNRHELSQVWLGCGTEHIFKIKLKDIQFSFFILFPSLVSFL